MEIKKDSLALGMQSSFSGLDAETKHTSAIQDDEIKALNENMLKFFNK